MARHKGNRPKTNSAEQRHKTRPRVESSSSAERWLLVGLGVLVLLHLVTSFMPGLSTWGVDYLSDVSLVWRVLLVVIFVLGVIPRNASAVDDITSRVLSAPINRVLAVVAFGILTFVFRMDALAYGDGFSFPAYFAGGNMPVIGVHLSTQYVDLVAHWAVYRYVVMPLGGDVALAYAAVASVAAIFGTWAILRIAQALSTDQTARRMIVAAALASGAVVMFFGHVESYTLVNVSLLWVIAFFCDAPRKRWLVWPAWGCWLAAVAFHQLAVVTLPAMMWVTFRTVRPKERSISRETVAVTFGLGFLAWLAATILYRMIGPPLFVPVMSTADSQYTAFSVHHLLDQINLVLFLAPVAVLALVAWFTRRESSRPSPRPGIAVLFAATAWMFAFWLDPLIGAFRDWDLLAVFGLPLSIWGGSYLAHLYAGATLPRRAWVPVAVFALLHVGGFIVSAQDEMTVVDRVNNLVSQDPHYAADFFGGTRLPPWATVLGTHLKRPDLAKPHLVKAVTADPTSAGRWANLGNSFENLGHADSALICYQRAVELDSINERYVRNLSVLQRDAGDWAGAIESLQRLMVITDTTYERLCMMGLLYGQTENYEDALSVLDEAKSMDPDKHLAFYYAGQINEILADTATAITEYDMALLRGGDAIVDIHKRRMQLLQWSGQTARAIAAGREWEHAFPTMGAPTLLLGTIFYVEQEYDTAKAFLDRARVKTPDDPTVTFYLGSVERNLGQFDSAKAHLEQALVLDPAAAYALLELVYLYDDVGDTAAARETTKRYLQRSPQDSGLIYLQRFLR